MTSAAVLFAESAKKQRWQQAISLLVSAAERRCHPWNLVGLSGALGACVGQGQWRQALHTLLWARSLRLSPDTVCFNSVISASARNVRWPVALSLLPVMRSFGAEPSTASYNAVLSAYALSLQWPRAVALLKAMRWQHQSELASYGAAIKACSGSHCWKLALNLIEEMQRGNLKPDKQAWKDVESGEAAAGFFRSKRSIGELAKYRWQYQWCKQDQFRQQRRKLPRQVQHQQLRQLQILLNQARLESQKKLQKVFLIIENPVFVQEDFDDDIGADSIRLALEVYDANLRLAQW
eukprot:TRINITY_DN103487_c0_g1_i1.p1 TRINITY_DN103487_c0_g1~~TRINITY_DN103487_c0_g1_i1.p1  ORF type:complete len:293 (+),score=49.34 TRINITY_DN103487_c0_g1_i1:263-1141(+)